MNDAIPVGSEGLLTTAQLAARADFKLGSATVSPSTRIATGPGGKADVEPRVMQVLVILADSAGQVVTRETLFERGWGRVIVGDDSLNRVIAAIRKIAADTAAGSFEIETIPRTGYRLRQQPPAVQEVRSSRRALLVGGAAMAAASAGGLWWMSSRNQRRFDGLMTRGDDALRDGFAFEQDQTRDNRNVPMVQLYEEAVQQQPDSAKAWGLLAYYRTAALDDAAPGEAPKLLIRSQATIEHALNLSPQEPNARLAKFLLEWPMHTIFQRDRTLRHILTTDPNNLLAMAELMPLLQAAGLTRESWYWNERILDASPLARTFLTFRALKLWIMGRVRDADSVIDRVRALWPDFWFGSYARFNLFALTGRPQAARAMLDTVPALLPLNSGPFPVILEALENPTPTSVEVARAACVSAARKHPPFVKDIVMFLGALDLTETAFEVTEGFLLWRGRIVSENQKNGKVVDDYSRRMTQWLFTPPLVAMRADPRFAKLCDDFGLTAYWRARRVEPDYRRFA